MDQDLIAYFDRQFSELNGRFSELNGQFSELNGRFSELDGRVSELDGRVSEQIQTLREEMVQRFEQADRRFERLETEVRHAHVAIEDLRGEIRLVAEGVASGNQQLERSRKEVSREIEETRLLGRLPYAQLEPRVSRLETRVSALEEDDE